MRVDEYRKLGAIKYSASAAANWWEKLLDQEGPFQFQWGELLVLVCAIILSPLILPPFIVTFITYFTKYQADKFLVRVRKVKEWWQSS